MVLVASVCSMTQMLGALSQEHKEAAKLSLQTFAAGIFISKSDGMDRDVLRG